MEDDDLQDVARRAFRDAWVRLQRAGVPDEALGELADERVVWIGPRRRVLRPVARVQRLGVFLITEHGDAYRAGAATRAVPPGHHRNTAVSIEQRRVMRELAYHGRFARGDVVNYDAASVDLSRIPAADEVSTERAVLVCGGLGELFVRWNPVALPDALQPFDAYVDEQVQLRVDRPHAEAD